MIYTVRGDAIGEVYNITPNKLEFAYDVNGALVFTSDQYAYYSISSAYNKSRQNAQGIDIYGNYMVIFRDDTYSLQLVNMTTWEIDYTIPTGLTTHGNDISFSGFFYDESDPFPLLFINGSNSPGLRIDLTNQSLTVVKTISAPPTGDTWVIYATAFNEDMTRYYCMGYNTNDYTDSSGFIFLETWDISENLENPTLLDSTTRAWFPCIQGMAYHDGLLWVASGMNNPVKVFAISPNDASIVKTVDLTRTGELEGIAWAYNADTGEHSCIYGQIYNGITYYRIIFSPTPI